MASKLSTGFLQLPAELRNEIYAFLIEDIDTNVGPKTICLRPRADFSKYWRKKNPHRGNHYSLNQVCRATRHEFGPLYVSQIAHRIRVDDKILPQFLESFFAEETMKNCFALTPRKVEVELTIPCRESSSRLNLTQLLTIYLSNEQMECKFLNKFERMPELDALFSGHGKAWKAAINQDLFKVLLWPPHGTTTRIELMFYDDARLEFIEKIPKGRWTTSLPSMHNYLLELGAEGIGERDARVGVWNPRARVKFVVSKQARAVAENKAASKNRVFETQYRLIEN
ncbi:hypothetical protein M3J09_005045 [Ascochyta lentis]